MPKMDKKYILKLMIGALRECGFEPSSPQLFERRLDDDLVKGWLGLSLATKVPGLIAVAPNVGVRNVEVEAQLAELLEEPANNLVATASVNLGYLAPENAYFSISFDGGTTSDAAKARQIVKAVEAYGLPFIEQNRTLGALARTLDDGGKMNENVAFRLPVVRRLIGQESAALAAVDEWERRLGDQQNPAALRYRRFADAFRKNGVSR